jgi:DNA-binding PadR family transcriptional regulator
MARRPSPQTVAVLEALLDRPTRWVHGYEVGKTSGLASGTLYPILMRLHDRGVLDTRWVDSPVEGRPRRHMYRLTEDGSRWARASVAEANPSPLSNPELGTA